MGAQISKRYSSYKSQPKAFKLFLNFCPNGLHKISFGIFEILKIEILTIFFVFINMGPNGVKISERYSYKSQPNVFKIILNFLPNGPHKTSFGNFEIFKIEILMIFFFVFLNMWPYGSQDFKTLFLLQIAAESFETFF